MAVILACYRFQNQLCKCQKVKFYWSYRFASELIHLPSDKCELIPANPPMKCHLPRLVCFQFLRFKTIRKTLVIFCSKKNCTLCSMSIFNKAARHDVALSICGVEVGLAHRIVATLPKRHKLRHLQNASGKNSLDPWRQSIAKAGVVTKTIIKSGAG